MADNFFKYARVFWRYEQGARNPGRPLGSEYTEQHAVDSDALLIAEAVGPGLTIDEFASLYEQVAALHSQYQSRQITNAQYQDEIWQLPAVTRQQRAKSNKLEKNPHYAPNRDSKNRPVAGPPKVDSRTPEKINRVRADPGTTPNVNFKDFWSGVLAKAAEIHSEPSGGAPPQLPPGHGEVPVMQGAPPVQGRQRKRGGLLDNIQAGLDAIGIADPTPVADGINAGISAIRALTDPKHAGSHMRNAGISLVSAAIPYLGDTAKLAKYGPKAADGAGGGGIGKTLAGMAGGAGGSGGGGGAIGNILGQFAGGVGRLGAAMGPVGWMLLGLTATFSRMAQWVGKVDEAGKRLLENNRELADFNTSIAANYATLENQRIVRTIERADQMAEPLGRMTDSRNEFEQAMEDLKMPFLKIGAEWQALKTTLATYAIRGLDAIEPIGKAVEWWYQNEQSKEADRNVLETLQREANERMAKRRIFDQ